MTSDQLALLGDTRLPSAARLIGFLISQHPNGLQATKSELAAIVGPSEAASDDTIGRHLKRLEASGWIRREAGGRGHPDRYFLIATHQCGANSPAPALRSAFRAALSNTTPSGAALNGDSPGTGAVLSPPVVVEEEEEVVEEEEETREAFEIDEKVQGLIDREESDVVGLRDSLVDYLTDRVQTDRQWGYVSSIRSWFDGSPSAPRGLQRLEPIEQRKLVAAALNELLQTDEVSEFRSARGKVGEISTLRTKVEYLLDRISKPADPVVTKTPKRRPRSPLPDPEVSHA